MDFERKVEIEVLIAEQHPSVGRLIAESEPSPLAAEESELGPTPDIASESEKPDQTALRAWVDDLTEFEVDHAGDSEAFAIADKLKSALADDVSTADRARMHADITASDEQEGFVGDFMSDTVLEGAAVEVPQPNEPDLPVANQNRYVDDEYNGGDGSGGGADSGGGTGGGDPNKPPSDDEPDDPKKKKVVVEAKKTRPEIATPKPEISAPKPARVPSKKRDGDQ